MAEVFVAFVDTPGLFASIIRRVLKQKYIHVVLSLDEDLNEAYSFGRRNPAVPIISGFEREDKNKVYKAFPTAEYMISSITCSQEQKEYIEKQLHEAYQMRYRYHYAVAGLPFIVFQLPFQQKRHYTCSSYLAKLFREAGIWKWDKDDSLITPKDFYDREEKKIVFEGRLRELVAEGEAKRPEIDFSKLLSGVMSYGH